MAQITKDGRGHLPQCIQLCPKQQITLPPRLQVKSPHFQLVFFFVIGIELFTSALKRNDIKGISVGGKQIKVTQFADDRTVFVIDHQSPPVQK